MSPRKIRIFISYAHPDDSDPIEVGRRQTQLLFLKRELEKPAKGDSGVQRVVYFDTENKGTTFDDTLRAWAELCDIAIILMDLDLQIRVIAPQGDTWMLENELIPLQRRFDRTTRDRVQLVCVKLIPESGYFEIEAIEREDRDDGLGAFDLFTREYRTPLYLSTLNNNHDTVPPTEWFEEQLVIDSKSKHAEEFLGELRAKIHAATGQLPGPIREPEELPPGLLAEARTLSSEKFPTDELVDDHIVEALWVEGGGSEGRTVSLDQLANAAGLSWEWKEREGRDFGGRRMIKLAIEDRLGSLVEKQDMSGTEGYRFRRDIFEKFDIGGLDVLPPPPPPPPPPGVPRWLISQYERLLAESNIQGSKAERADGGSRGRALIGAMWILGSEARGGLAGNLPEIATKAGLVSDDMSQDQRQAELARARKVLGIMRAAEPPLVRDNGGATKSMKFGLVLDRPEDPIQQILSRYRELLARSDSPISRREKRKNGAGGEAIIRAMWRLQQQSGDLAGNTPQIVEEAGSSFSVIADRDGENLISEARELIGLMRDAQPPLVEHEGERRGQKYRLILNVETEGTELEGRLAEVFSRYRRILDGSNSPVAAAERREKGRVGKALIEAIAELQSQSKDGFAGNLTGILECSSLTDQTLGEVEKKQIVDRAREVLNIMRSAEPPLVEDNGVSTKGKKYKLT